MPGAAPKSPSTGQTVHERTVQVSLSGQMMSTPAYLATDAQPATRTTVMLSEPQALEPSPGSADDLDADDVSKYESASSGHDYDSDELGSDDESSGEADAPVYGTLEYQLAFLAACEARGASPAAAKGVYAAFVEAQRLYTGPAADEGAQATGDAPDGGVPPASAADDDELTAAVGLLTLQSTTSTPSPASAAFPVASADAGLSESRRSPVAYASTPVPRVVQAAPAAAATQPLPSVYVAPGAASRGPALPASGGARRPAGPPGARGRSGASHDHSSSPSPSPPLSSASETPPPPPTSQYSFLNPHPVGGWNDAPPDVLARRQSITPDPAKKALKRRVYAGQSARSSGSPSPTPPAATLPTSGRQPLELTQEQQMSVNEQLADLAAPGPSRPVSLSPGGGAPPPPPRQRLTPVPAPSPSPAPSPAPSRIMFCSGPGEPLELCCETQEADLKRCRAEAVRFMDSTFGPGTQVREIIGGSCPRSHVVVSSESLDRWRSGIDERRFLELQVFRDNVQIDLWHIFEDGTTTPVGRPLFSTSSSSPGMQKNSSAPTPDDSDDDQEFQPAPSTPSASPMMAKTATLLRNNIARLSERGERLDSLVDSTDSLATSSAGFRKGAGRSKASRMSFSPADFLGKIFGVSSPPASPSPRAGGGLSFELPQPGTSSGSYAQPRPFAGASPHGAPPLGDASPFGAPADSYVAPSPFGTAAPPQSMGYAAPTPHADFAQAGPLYTPAADGELPSDMLLDESAYPLVYDNALAYPSPPAHPYYDPTATVAPNDIFQAQPTFPLPLPADPFAYQQSAAYEPAPAPAASTPSYAPIVYSPPAAPVTLPPPIAEPKPKKKRAPRASTSASHPTRPADKFPSAEFKAWFKLEEHYTLEADGSWQCIQDACVRHNAPGSGARRKVGHYTGPQATFRLAAMKHVNKHLEENKPEDAVLQLERLLGIAPVGKGASRGVDPVAFILANVPKSQNDFEVAQTPLSYTSDYSNPYDLNGYQSSASSSDPRSSSYASSTPSFSTGSPGSPSAPPSAPWRITDDYTWVAAESSFHCRACPPRVGQTGGRREGIYKAIGEFNFSSITTRARQHAEKHRASASPPAASVPAVAFDPAQYYSQMQDPTPPSFHGQAQQPSPPSFYNDQPFQQQFVTPQEQLNMLGWATQGPPAPAADAWVPQVNSASPGWGY